MSQNKPDLLVDFCDYKAAKFAVMNWHYSKSMPVGKLVKIGIWENGDFVGCVLFGRGANNHIGNPYNLAQTQICELTRIALTTHYVEISRIISLSVTMIKRISPGMRLIVSYADPEQRHLGIVYQAANWIYTGRSQAQCFTLGLKGEIIHKKSIHSKYGSIVGLPKSKLLWKHKYLYPLDKRMRRQILPLAQPYPKRAGVV